MMLPALAANLLTMADVAYRLRYCGCERGVGQ
jgi:hypothetical protein